MKKVKDSLIKAGLSVGSLVLCFLILEGASRIFFDKPAHVRMIYIQETIPANEQDIVMFGLPDEGFNVCMPIGLRLKQNSKEIARFLVDEIISHDKN